MEQYSQGPPPHGESTMAYIGGRSEWAPTGQCSETASTVSTGGIAGTVGKLQSIYRLYTLQNLRALYTLGELESGSEREDAEAAL